MGSHLQLYPTGQRRVNDGGRAGCPGQEAPRQGKRESRVSQNSSPPPPSPPPPPQPTGDHHHHQAAGQQHTAGREAEPRREGGTKTGNPGLTAQRGGAAGTSWGLAVRLRGGLSCVAGPGVGTGEGRAGEGAGGVARLHGQPAHGVQGQGSGGWGAGGGELRGWEGEEGVRGKLNTRYV